MATESVLASRDTLVRYGNPVLVSRRPERPASPTGLPAAAQGDIGLPPTEKAKSTEEVLNCILPPREWEENGQLWRQTVSSEPATREDVKKLGEQLDTGLQQQQARETGICPVRRKMFSQCFDEIIRQVTINCCERGLLLLRVRDEMRMATAAYQTLYESSVAFGIRKALQAEQGKCDMEETIVELKDVKAELERQVAELRAKAEQIERRASELRQAEERKHSEEVDFLKKTNQQLKSQLEGIIAPKK
ncbi:33 kDa inner dynein arm light chain, axonemal-like [Macrosteles quadrilineatus]|uniref:33 kDa inner dynein arm light chain, axonemal-like n=1 Tax=Macrosteles quadrilineatus TaxID=74068 RepID=UPI0023E10F1C|nr:33 kDa inner dynein arm light chain, axonemal-like [Macrosteles quadrilineatus]XP_054289422.1 33 kDa inner dynein arm light chain, axonemal-like [Macrosteles quadrilineatus]